jgi:hypothetical protein
MGTSITMLAMISQFPVAKRSEDYAALLLLMQQSSIINNDCNGIDEY